ncbi:MAG: FHA domain-containing protein [Planctomycetaceae bacterium]|nr:MAG: FHA domain-containing protein [Planctomycetaceae bacterium]
MARVELKVLEGRQAGKTIPLHVRQFLIGREQDCHLRPNSDLISRHHCVFTIDDASIRLRDLGSTNGTFVNGERIQGQVVLRSGDRVSVGKLAFEVVVRETVSAAPVAAGPAASSPDSALPTTAEEDDQSGASSSATIEFPAVAPTDDTTVFAAMETATGLPVALPAGYTPEGGYPQMPYGVPPQYGVPGYPPGYGVPGYPPQGYGQYPYPVPGYGMPPQGYMPNYPMQQMMPGYAPPQQPPAETTVADAETTRKKASAGAEAPPMVLPDPESTGVKAPPPPPPAPPVDPSAPPVAEQRKPSDAAADIIRNQRTRRG